MRAGEMVWGLRQQQMGRRAHTGLGLHTHILMDRILASRPMFSTMSSTRPRVFIKMPRLAQKPQLFRVTILDTRMLGTNLAMHAIRICSVGSAPSHRGHSCVRACGHKTIAAMCPCRARHSDDPLRPTVQYSKAPNNLVLTRGQPFVHVYTGSVQQKSQR